MNHQWTDPYLDTSHYGECSLKTRWATVVDWGEFAELVTWIPGVGFGSPEYTFHGPNALAQAKLAGETWVNRGVEPESTPNNRAMEGVK